MNLRSHPTDNLYIGQFGIDVVCGEIGIFFFSKDRCAVRFFSYLEIVYAPTVSVCYFTNVIKKARNGLCNDSRSTVYCEIIVSFF